MLGAEAFSATLAEKEEAWQRRFAEAEEAERNLAPCLICRERREFVSVSSQDDRICCGCAHEVWRAAFGSCLSCGGERESHRRCIRRGTIPHRAIPQALLTP